MRWSWTEAAAGRDAAKALPHGWGQTRVADISWIVNGAPYDSKHFGDLGEPLLRIRDLAAQQVETRYDGPELTGYRVTGDSLLVGMDGDFNVGRWILEEPALLNQRVLAIEADPLWSKWIEYCLPPALKVINDLTYATTVKHLSSVDVAKIRIPSPPRELLRAIADYLDHETAEIENLVADQRKFQILLEELRSSEISRAFPTEDPVRLKWVLDMAITGPFGTALSASEYITGGVPVINPTHIHRGQIASDLDVSISEEKAAALSRFRMNVGDIILGRKGEVDKAALVDHRFAGSICGSDSMLLRPSTQLHSEYFWWFLQSPQAQSQLQLWSVGSTVQGLNQNTINRIHIPCPPVDMQEQISDQINGRATGIDDLLRETTRVMQLARERRAALITAAVTGQIDVTARHKPAAEQLEDDIAQGLHREN